MAFKSKDFCLFLSQLLSAIIVIFTDIFYLYNWKFKKLLQLTRKIKMFSFGISYMLGQNTLASKICGMLRLLFVLEMWFTFKFLKCFMLHMAEM